MRTRRKMSRTAVLGLVVAAVAALLALPAAASADAPSWVEADGQPLGTQSPNGATGFDDRVTATVSGMLNFGQELGPVDLGVSCEVTAEIELWNDGPGLAPAKNRIVSLDDAGYCYGTAGPFCTFTDMTANNLPWSGSVGPLDYGLHASDFSGVDITWTVDNCTAGAFALSGTLDTWAYVAHCPDYGHEGYGIEDTLSNPLGSVEVAGELLTDSVDGLYEPGGCVTLSDV